MTDENVANVRVLREMIDVRDGYRICEFMDMNNILDIIDNICTR